MTTRLVLALVVVGAAAASAALGPRYGGALTVGVLDLPASLEPTPPTSDGGRLLAGLVSETLVGLAADGSPVPGLARSWFPSASGREWTLQLADAATFHDGQPVKASEAVRSLRRFLRGPGNAADHLARSLEGGPAFRARRSEDLPGVLALDETRVVLRFAAAAALPFAPLASPAAALTSASGKGAGPFVPTVLVPGRRAAFTAFTGHVRGRPYFDQLEVLALGDREAARTARRSGRVDVTLEDGDASAHAALLLCIDPRRTPFRSKEARGAVAGAIDRAELVARFVPGGSPLSSLLVPALLPVSGLAPTPAQHRLHGRVTLLVGRDVPLLVSQRIVAHLLDLGLSVDAVPEPASEIKPAEAGLRLLLFLPELAEAGLALEELAALVPPAPGAVQALEAAARETDADRRRALLLQAEESLRAEAALLGLAAFPLAPATDARVHGLRVDPAGRLLLEGAWQEP